MAIIVKICGLTRRQDVESAIAAGADVLGFVFDQGPCFLTLEQGRALLDTVRRSTCSALPIAVVGNLNQKQIQDIVDLGFTAVQAVAPAYPAAKGTSASLVVPAFFDSPDLAPRVRGFRANNGSRFDAFAPPLTGCINVDGRGGGGTGTQTDWAVAGVLASEGPLMLAGGLTSDNVATAIAQVRPRAVDVSSGVEASPGIKDPRRIRDFVSAAKSV